MKNKLKKTIEVFKFINSHPLAGKHRVHAYYKFISWQLLQLFKPGEKKVPFTQKTFLLANKGMTGATGNIYTGLHEFYDMAFLLHFLRPNDLFYDIGANIGSYSILASGHCSANTVSFEPILSTFIKLNKNVSLNNIDHLVTTKNVGLGDNKTTLKFTNSMDTVNHVLSSNEGNGDAVDVQVLVGDEVMTDTGCPILMKIDVEGYETSVLNGMHNLLHNEKLKAIIIELNGSGLRYGFNEQDIHIKLINIGFTACQYNPFKRKINIVDAPGPHNTIYFRDINFVQKRIDTAEKVTLFSESF
jgi:FkbM family methyltransferase